MLYVSQQLDDFTTLNVEITDENVFAKCCDCGRETPVNLNAAIETGCPDLFGVRWRCDGCTYQHALRHRGEPWAQQVIKQHTAMKNEE